MNTQQVVADEDGFKVDLPTPKDSDTGRNWLGRWAVLALCLLFIVGIPYYLLSRIGIYLGWPETGWYAGLLAGGFVASKIVPHYFFVNSREWFAYVTGNLVHGLMGKYGPGVHVKYPTEINNKEGNYPLKPITETFTAIIPTRSSEVTIEGEIKYAIHLPRIDRAIGIGELAMSTALTGFVENTLTVECTKQGQQGPQGGAVIDHDADWAIKNVRHLNRVLRSSLQATETTNDPQSFKEDFGFNVVLVVIRRVTLAKEVQKARNAVDEGKSIFQVVAELHGMDVATLRRRIGPTGDIKAREYSDMLKYALTVADNAKMNVQAFMGAIPSAAQSLAKGGQP